MYSYLFTFIKARTNFNIHAQFKCLMFNMWQIFRVKAVSNKFKPLFFNYKLLVIDNWDKFSILRREIK